MLVGIISIEKHDYYIYLLKDKQERKVLDVVKVGQNKIVHLNEKNIRQLFYSALQSNIRYSHKENGYDVYLDESGNKRFYKNGIEDIKLFFLKNGKDAVNYRRDNEEDFEDDYDEEEYLAYCYKIKYYGRLVKILACTSALAIVLDLFLMYKLDVFKKPQSDFYMLAYGRLTTDEIRDYILDSDLSEDQKELLTSGYLIDDVLDSSLYNSSLDSGDISLKNFELFQRFKHIEIRNFSINNVEALGYYSPIEPSNIYMCDKVESGTDTYNDILAHEFVHLLQIPGGYSYIIESCAEIISCEYYDAIPDGYKEQVKRTKVLMEIIGPEVVFNYNFNKNDETFKNALKKYLSDEEYNRLIELFESVPKEWGKNEEEINKEIDSLLSTMYYRKNNRDIKDDKLITLIYEGDNSNNIDTERIYFNKHHKNYNKDLVVSIEEEQLPEIPIGDILDGKNAIKYRYIRVQRYNYEDENILLNDSVIFDNIIYEPRNDVTIYKEDDSISLGTNNSFEKYTLDDGVLNGMLVKKREVGYFEESDTFNIFKAKEYGYVDVFLDDGSCERFRYNYSSGIIEFVERYTCMEYIAPPINKNSKNECLTRVRKIDDYNI